MLKRALSLLLASVMVFSLLPVSVLAEETALDTGESVLLEPATLAEAEPEAPPSATEGEIVLDETEATETEAPETEAPEESPAPETEAPEESPAPETEAPEESPAPEEEASETDDVLTTMEGDAPVGDPVITLDQEVSNVTLEPYSSITYRFTPEETAEYVFLFTAGDRISPEITTASDGLPVDSLFIGNSNVQFSAKAGDEYCILLNNSWTSFSRTVSFVVKKAVPPESIELPYPIDATGYPGDSIYFTPKVSPENADWRTLDVYSEDPNVAKATLYEWNPLCLSLVLVGSGETNVVITSTDSVAELRIPVSVAAVNGDLSLDKTKKVTLAPGKRVAYRFTPTKDGNYVFWEGNFLDGDVQVSNEYGPSGGTGLVFFHASAGETRTLVFSPNTNETRTYALTVSEQTNATGYSLEPISGYPGDSQSVQLKYEPVQANRVAVSTWTIEDPSIAIREWNDPYSDQCTIRFLKPGETKLTATLANGEEVSTTITVEAPPALEVGQSETLTLSNGETAYYQFTAPKTASYSLVYDSDTVLYASVSQDGTNYTDLNSSTPLKAEEGTVYTIRFNCWSETDVTATFHLEEAPPLESITLGYIPNTSGYAGQTIYISVSYAPANADPGKLTWETSDENVATLGFQSNYNGTSGCNIQLVGPGTATITISAENCEPVEVPVTVYEVTETIELDGTITANLKDSEKTAFYFTPAEDGEYAVYEANGVDSRIEVYELTNYGSCEYRAGDQGSTSFYGLGGHKYLIIGQAYYYTPYTYTYCVTKTVEPTSLTLSLDSYTGFVPGNMYLGLQAKFTPANATTVPIRWSSSDPSVASINDWNSRWNSVELHKAGTAIITASATVGGEELSASCTVTLKESIVWTGESNEVTFENGELQGYLFTAPQDGTYILSHQSGPYRPLAEIYRFHDDYTEYMTGSSGNALRFDAKQGEKFLIKLDPQSNQTYTMPFHLAKAVAPTSITLEYPSEASGSEASGYVGETVSIQVSVSPANADPSGLTWTTSDDKVAVIDYTYDDNTGCNVWLVGPGTATITVSAKGCAPVEVPVTANEVTQTIALDGTITANLKGGEKTAFYFTPDEDGEYAVYETTGHHSYIEVFEITEDGRDQYCNSGQDSISFSATKGHKYLILGHGASEETSKYTYCVTKAVEPTGLTLSGKSYTGFATGSSFNFRLEAKFEPANAKTSAILWSSSDPSVASVSNNNWDSTSTSVELHKAGTAIITASATVGDKVLSDTCTVTIKVPEVWEGGDKNVTFENAEPHGYLFTAAEEGTYVLSYPSGPNQPLVVIYRLHDDNYTEQMIGGSGIRFDAKQGEKFLINLYPQSNQTYTMPFHLGLTESFASISIPLPDPMACNLNEIFEGDLIYLDSEQQQILNHARARIKWTAGSGLQILESSTEHFRVKAVKEGTYTLTATVLDDNNKPSAISTSVTFQIGPKPADFTDGKRILPAHSMQPYSFTAPASGDYTLWTDSDRWVVFEIVDLVDNCSIGYSDNLLRCTLQQGRSYLVYAGNLNDEPLTVNAFLKQNVEPTGIAINGDIEQRFVGDTVYLYADGEPVNSTLDDIQWKLIAGKADISVEGQECIVTPKSAGAITVKATSGSISGEITFTALANNFWEPGTTQTTQGWEPVAYQFTAPEDGAYIVWQEGSDHARIEVRTQQGEFPGVNGGGYCQFDANAGETYRILLWPNSDEGSTFRLETLAEDGPTRIAPLYEGDMIGYVGDSITLPLAYTPGNVARGKIRWESSNPKVAEIVEDEYRDEDTVRLIAKGTATITATHENGATTEFQITVKTMGTLSLDKPVSVTLEDEGDTAAYSFTPASSGTYVIYDETNQFGSVEVEVSSNEFGTEHYWGDNRVQFTAQKGQTCRIVFHHWRDSETTYSYVLTRAAAATGIRLDVESLNGLPGDTRYLSVVCEPLNADLSGLTWEIDNTEVAALVGGDNATNREIRLLGKGEATLTVTLGNLEAKCPITVGAAREELMVGNSAEISLDFMASAGYVFTPEESGNYYFYEEKRDWVTTEVFTADGEWVDGTGDGKVRILNAQAGKPYYITVINDMYQEEHPFTFHLEKAVDAESISLSKTGVTDRYVYQGDTLWVVAYTAPVNGYQGLLTWSISDEYKKYVTFEEEQYDPRGDGVCLTIADGAPEGTMILTCTDTETGLSATQKIHIKSYGTLSAGKDYTVTQTNAEEYDLATFTPAEDGTYVLVTSGRVGAAVFTDNEFIGETGNVNNTEMILALKAGVRYTVESVNLDKNGAPAVGTYTLCILKDGANPLSFAPDYVSIKQDGSEKLSLHVQSETLRNRPVYYASLDESIVTVDENGTVTAVEGASGTTYVIASLTLGGRPYTARCRVDVFAEEAISGVQLSTTAPTVELYSTNYTTVTAIPYKQTTSGKSVVLESLSIPVEGAEFVTTDKLSVEDLALLKYCFALEVLDGRTVQIVPNEDIAASIFNKEEDAPALKSSYTVNLQLTFEGENTPQIVPIKLTLKKTVPTLKTSKHTFNSFLTGDTLPIVLTGGTVTGIDENIAMQTNKSNALASWLDLNEDGTLSLQSGVTGSKSGNVYLDVDVEGWIVPAKVTVPVSAAYSAPSLKLSATSVSISSTHSNGVDLQLLCGEKGQTLDQLYVDGIQVDEENETEYTCDGFDPETGSFTLVSTESNTGKAKSVILWVSFTKTESKVPLTVKVTPKAPTIAAKPTSVKLNCLRNDSALITLTPSSADYQLESLDDLAYKVVNRQNEETDELDVSFEEGALRVSTTSDTALGATYKLILNAIGNEAKKTTITITTLTETQSTITASAKVTGAVDLTFPDSYAVVQPTFTNYTNGDYDLVDFAITDSKGVVKPDYEGVFRLEEVDGQYRLSVANPDDPDNQPATGTYYLKPLWQLGNGLDPDKTSLIKFTVKRTAVSLKASTTRIILNKEIDEQVTVDISCLTNGYDFDEPKVIKTTTGLDVTFADGKLTIQAGEAAYGKTHTIALKARDVKEDKELKVSVVIPKQGSKIGATLKAKGTIDLVRDSTSVVITPTYTNYSGQGTLTTGLTIKKYAISDKKYLSGEDVTDDEFSVVENENGTFTVTKVTDADIDLKNYRYRAEMTFDGVEDESLVTTPVVALSLKSNAVKATVSGTPVLYKTDKYSRATFRLNIADATVNEITDVVPANALYQIEDYGDGEYAVCFDPDQWKPTTKYPTSLALNVFLDGNTNAATKVTLKLSLK